jgi:hypothetical protein
MVLLSGLLIEAVVAEIDRIIRPVDDRGLDFLACRYSYLRRLSRCSSILWRFVPTGQITPC